MTLFSELYPFNQLVDSSKLFNYLLELPEIDEIEIQEIPEHFNEWIKMNLGEECKFIIELAFSKLDDKILEVETLLEKESQSCKPEYTQGTDGQYYETNFEYSDHYKDLDKKKDWLDKLFNTPAFYEL